MSALAPFLYWGWISKSYSKCTVNAALLITQYQSLSSIRRTLHLRANDKQNRTVPQTTSIIECRTALLKRIQQFRELQQIYMPGFDPENSTYLPSPSTSVDVEGCKLYMPSELSEADRHIYCPGDLADLEERLRFAEASDSLESLRHQLRTRSFTNGFKIANVTGQIRNTQARETQSRIDDRVRAAEWQYRHSRDSLLKLRGHGSWEDILRVLEPSDVRALNERDMTAQEKEDIQRVRERSGATSVGDASTERVATTAAAIGEGQRRPLWIWFSGNLQEDENDTITRAGEVQLLLYGYDLLMGTVGLGVEWAKTKARADRWEEEVVLLDEEMRRVLVFCNWKAAWWKEQVSLRNALPRTLMEGLHAYAGEQAGMELSIHAAWTAKWYDTRKLAQPLLKTIAAEARGAGDPRGL